MYSVGRLRRVLIARADCRAIKLRELCTWRQLFLLWIGGVAVYIFGIVHLISSASCYFLRPKLRVWHELVSTVLNVVLTDANDRFKWNLTENSEFMVRSMYKDLNAS